MSRPPTLGWILAGGAGRRLGGSKAGAMLEGVPLLTHALRCAGAECAVVVVNGNPRDLPPLSPEVTVVPDPTLHHRGPLVGLRTGLDYLARRQGGMEWLATFPVDTPFVPTDLPTRLHRARGNAPAVICCSEGRRHPTLGLWHRSLRRALTTAMDDEGMARIGDWARRCGAVELDLGWGDGDPCFNINTPEDLKAAAARLGRG